MVRRLLAIHITPMWTIGETPGTIVISLLQSVFISSLYSIQCSSLLYFLTILAYLYPVGITWWGDEPKTAN